MAATKAPDRSRSGPWQFFASVRLSVVLLISLAATSIVGTLIPQNQDPAHYHHLYGDALFRLFSRLQLFDMYHSWWFQLLLLLLAVNITVCSADRLKATWKIIFPKNRSLNPSALKKSPLGREFDERRPAGELEGDYRRLVAGWFRHPRYEKTAKGFSIMAEKGRWTRLGVYVVHGSILLLLLGGLVGSIFGYEGFMNIAEGEKSDHVMLRGMNQTRHLDFAVRLDDFSLSFYESGTPKEYRSSLTVLENGEPVLKKDIIVNDPLTYRGISLFQSSYGMLPPKEVTLSFTDPKTGMSYTRQAALGAAVDVPEGKGRFTLVDYTNEFGMGGHSLGAAFVGTLSTENGQEQQVILPTRFPNFDRMRQGDLVIAVADFEPVYYSGIQVTRDPGVWIVYAGFILLIVGCYITFFRSHQKLYLEVVDQGGKRRVILKGSANKNRLGMERKIDRLARRMGLEKPDTNA